MTWAGTTPPIPWTGQPDLASRVKERWGPYRIQPADLPLASSVVTLYFPSLAAWVKASIDVENGVTNNGIYRIGDDPAEVTPAFAALRHSFSMRYQNDFPQTFEGPWQKLVVGRGSTAPTQALIIWAGLTDLPNTYAGSYNRHAGLYGLFRNDGNDPT